MGKKEADQQTAAARDEQTAAARDKQAKRKTDGRWLLVGGTMIFLTLFGILALFGRGFWLRWSSTGAPARPIAPTGAIMPTGPHVWEIDGQKIPLQSTYWYPLSDGIQFTIQLEWDGDFSTLDQDTATRVGLPLMKYARDHGLPHQLKPAQDGPPETQIRRIGVVLIEPGGTGRGFRVTLLLTELDKLLLSKP